MSYLRLRTILLSDDINTLYLSHLKDLAFLSFEQGMIAHIWYFNYIQTSPLNLLYYRHLQAHESMKMQLLATSADKADVFIRGTPAYHNPYSGILKNIPDHLYTKQFCYKPFTLSNHGHKLVAGQFCDQLRIVAQSQTAPVIPTQIINLDEDFELNPDNYILLNVLLEKLLMHMADEFVDISSLCASCVKPYRSTSKLRFCHCKCENRKMRNSPWEKPMKDLIPLGLGAYDSDSDEEFLVEYDAYVRAEARKVASWLFTKGVFDLEADELAQIIRIKLWNARQKHTISNPPAYIRMIAHSTAVDMIRRHRSSISLPTDADGELSLGNLLVARNKGYQDPAYEIELGEIDPYLLKKLVQGILSLPPRQRQSLLFSLRARWEEGLPLIRAFKAQGLDIEVLDFPDEARVVHLLKASLSAARKKLHSLREKDSVT